MNNLDFSKKKKGKTIFVQIGTIVASELVAGITL